MSIPVRPKNREIVMKRLLFVWLLSVLALSVQAQELDVQRECLRKVAEEWISQHRKADYPRYGAEDYREVAANLAAYQNPDGGWPKNLDWMTREHPDSVLARIDAKHRRSTLDNRNVYPQLEFLSAVWELTGDETCLRAARGAVEYMLNTQYDNGGWRGWDADAITYNDDIMAGVLTAWKEILDGAAPYGWVAADPELLERIRRSFDAGIDLVLRTQYVQNGVKTVWAQQHDHKTLQPTSARKYEHPGLSAAESSQIVMLLMSIENQSPEVIEAVRCAVAWFEKTRIDGKRVETVSLPEGNPDDPKVKKDRYLVDDPDAPAIWARFYELEDNRPFFSNRDGIKVYTLKEVKPERRVGYAWYGPWGRKVLNRYKKWSKKLSE